MKPPFRNITGKKLVRAVTRAELFRMILNILLVLFFAVFFSYLSYCLIISLPDSWFFVFTAPAWILAFYFPIKAIQPRDGGSRRYAVSQPLMLASLSRQIEMLTEDLKNHMTLYAPECKITSFPW